MEQPSRGLLLAHGDGRAAVTTSRETLGIPRVRKRAEGATPEQELAGRRAGVYHGMALSNLVPVLCRLAARVEELERKSEETRR